MFLVFLSEKRRAAFSSSYTVLRYIIWRCHAVSCIHINKLLKLAFGSVSVRNAASSSFSKPLQSIMNLLPAVNCRIYSRDFIIISKSRRKHSINKIVCQHHFLCQLQVITQPFVTTRFTREIASSRPAGHELQSFISIRFNFTLGFVIPL